MKKLAELRKKLADLKAAGTKALDAIEAAGRDPSDDADYQAIKEQIAATEQDIAAAEAVAEERRSMQALAPAGHMTVHDSDPSRTFGFRDMGEFAASVRNAMVPGGTMDRRLLGSPTNVHQGGASSGEGYEVPPEFRDRIFEVVTAMDEFGGLVDSEPTSKREVKDIADETTPWGASGVTASWRGEGTQMTPSKLVTEPRTTTVHELYAYVLATEEMLEDAPRLASRITSKAGQAIAWKRNNAMIYGDGVGKPLGWMASQAKIEVAKESSQSADTIVAKNIMKMYSRLLRIPGDNPIWIANSDTLPELMSLTIGDRPVWTPPNGIAGAPGGFLLGLPILLSEHAKTVGDAGDIQLISPKGYFAPFRDGGPRYAESMHLYFDYAIQAFRWTFRFGGRPHLSAPVTPANGTNTKSHFVALAARA